MCGQNIFEHFNFIKIKSHKNDYDFTFVFILQHCLSLSKKEKKHLLVVQHEKIDIQIIWYIL
jgi:hypothetical protein